MALCASLATLKVDQIHNMRQNVVLVVVLILPIYIHYLMYMYVIHYLLSY